MNLSLLKAAFYRPPNTISGELALPTQVLEQQYQINPRHCENYHKLVAWNSGIASVIHPNYLQVLTLPMQLSMMVSKPFPFKPMGLVHLANEIHVNELPEQNAELTLRTSFDGLQAHKRGYVFALKSEGFIGRELAIAATSYYLARIKHDVLTATKPDLAVSTLDTQQLLPTLGTIDPEGDTFLYPSTFEQGIGRRYARVSGDYNPIHLSRWSAKLLGFRRAIAHGMYSKAVCVSMLAKNDVFSCRTANPSIFANKVIATQFVQPIYLPSEAQIQVGRTKLSSKGISNDELKGIAFTLSSKKGSKTRLHLQGEVSDIKQN